MRVMGVDPGSAITGFGVIEKTAAGLIGLCSGTIKTNVRDRAGERLLKIYQRIATLIEKHRPDAVSLERSFAAMNIQSAFRLGEARAMVMLAAAQRAVPLHEYAPNHVKLMVAADGHAGKEQVKFMVRRTLRLDDREALADDASDALALALCHLSIARQASHYRERASRPES